MNLRLLIFLFLFLCLWLTTTFVFVSPSWSDDGESPKSPGRQTTVSDFTEPLAAFAAEVYGRQPVAEFDFTFLSVIYPQYNILRALKTQALTAVQLREAAGISAQDLFSKTVRGLIENGLVDRQKLIKNSPMYGYALTRGGREFLERYPSYEGWRIKIAVRENPTEQFTRHSDFDPLDLDLEWGHYQILLLLYRQPTPARQLRPSLGEALRWSLVKQLVKWNLVMVDSTGGGHYALTAMGRTLIEQIPTYRDWKIKSKERNVRLALWRNQSDVILAIKGAAVPDDGRVTHVNRQELQVLNALSATVPKLIRNLDGHIFHFDGSLMSRANIGKYAEILVLKKLAARIEVFIRGTSQRVYLQTYAGERVAGRCSNQAITENLRRIESEDPPVD
jgi:DNA-binding HxlR family transcriptional regulator